MHIRYTANIGFQRQPERFSAGADSRLVQLTAGTGDAQCQWVLQQLSDRLTREGKKAGVKVTPLSQALDKSSGLPKSRLLKLDGPAIEAFLKPWQGTVKWMGKNMFNATKPRTAYYVGVAPVAAIPPEVGDLGEVRVQAVRSQGPGGQNVNKTSSAVRVTHIATGLTVKAQEHSTQGGNLKAAHRRLKERLQIAREAQADDVRGARRQQHAGLLRGKPVKIFTGPNFQQIK